MLLSKDLAYDNNSIALEAKITLDFSWYEVKWVRTRGAEGFARILTHIDRGEVL